MTERFENRLDKSNKKFNTLNPVWDNEKETGLNVFEMIDLMNKLNNEVNFLEAKIEQYLNELNVNGMLKRDNEESKSELNINDYDGVFPDYFTYDNENRIIKIHVNEYEHPKSEFRVDTELEECISAINRLYCKCDDDRISYDDDANTEFYTREAIQFIPQKELLFLKRRLEYVKGTDEELKVKHQIEILEEIVDEIEDIVYLMDGVLNE